MGTLLDFAKELEKSISSNYLDNTFTNLQQFALEKEDLPKLYLQISDIHSIADNLLKYSVLALWWFSSNLDISCRNTKSIDFSKYCEQLIYLCKQFRIFDFGIKIGEHFYNNNYIKENLCRDSPSWRIFLNYTQCLRREGRYEEAHSIYARIAEDISNNKDIVAHAQLLLNMGKAAHNHQWRTGYSHCLIMFATKRFQLLLNKEPIGSIKYKEYARFLAICLDSQAINTFEVKQYTGDDNQSNIKLSKQLQTIWKKALYYAKQSDNYNSEIRILCRSSIAEFQLTEVKESQLSALKEFDSALKKLEARDDQRGLAVRYRQYAEMLAQFDSEKYKSDITSYLKKSVAYAKNEKDSRTEATNLIALAKIYFNAKYENTDYTVEQINVALRKLNLQHNDRLPELEVDAHLELARQLRSIGNYRDSKEYLIKAYKFVLEIEQRLHSDLNSYKSIKHSLTEKNTYVPMCLLTRSEKQKVREALFSDFQLLSVLIHKVVKEQLITADFAASQSATELQLDFYQDCLRGHAHSFKGIIDNFKAGIQRVGIDNQDQPLYVVLKKTAEQVEKKFIELLEDNNSLITEFVSVRKSVENVITEIRKSSRFMFKGVIFKCEDSDDKKSDFSIYCCPKILESVLDNLIINAARAVINSSVGSKKEVNVRILVVSNINSGRSFGIIEIEDTAGDVQKLQQALKLPENKTYGLRHAVKFFQGFNGQFKSDGIQQEYTLLKIEIPFGDRIQI